MTPRRLQCAATGTRSASSFNSSRPTGAEESWVTPWPTLPSSGWSGSSDIWRANGPTMSAPATRVWPPCTAYSSTSLDAHLKCSPSANELRPSLCNGCPPRRPISSSNTKSRTSSVTCLGTADFALRDRALVLFLYNTGAREQEVADLRVEHLDLGEHPSYTYTARATSGGHGRFGTRRRHCWHRSSDRSGRQPRRPSRCFQCTGVHSLASGSTRSAPPRRASP